MEDKHLCIGLIVLILIIFITGMIMIQLNLHDKHKLAMECVGYESSNPVCIKLAYTP